MGFLLLSVGKSPLLLIFRSEIIKKKSDDFISTSQVRAYLKKKAGITLDWSAPLWMTNTASRISW